MAQSPALNVSTSQYSVTGMSNYVLYLYQPVFY